MLHKYKIESVRNLPIATFKTMKQLIFTYYPKFVVPNRTWDYGREGWEWCKAVPIV